MHVVSGPECFVFGYSNFLPQPKDKHVHLIGDCKLAVDVNSGVCLFGNPALDWCLSGVTFCSMAAGISVNWTSGMDGRMASELYHFFRSCISFTSFLYSASLEVTHRCVTSIFLLSFVHSQASCVFFVYFSEFSVTSPLGRHFCMLHYLHLGPHSKLHTKHSTSFRNKGV